jgi:hypothetical protein
MVPLLAPAMGVTQNERGTTMKNILPPDPQNMNESRAAWALCALRAFETETGIDGIDAATDLLCALMHLADRKGWNFERVLQRACSAYEAETIEESPTLLQAAKLVIKRWSEGDLADAVRQLDAAIEAATSRRPS